MLKSYGVVGWGVVAHVILVSALGPHFGLGLGLRPELDNRAASPGYKTGPRAVSPELLKWT